MANKISLSDPDGFVRGHFTRNIGDRVRVKDINHWGTVMGGTSEETDDRYDLEYHVKLDGSDNVLPIYESALKK